MLRYKEKGFFAFNLAMAVMLLSILAGADAGINMYYAYQTKMAKEECDVLDRAIGAYSKAHSGVADGTVKWDSENNKVKYEQEKRYPKDKSELAKMQDLGYFTKDIDLSKYTYRSYDDETEYVLEVTLPNDEVYRSIGSKE